MPGPYIGIPVGGEVVLGAYLDATPLTIPAPALATATLTQNHHVTGNPVAVPHPVLATFFLNQDHHVTGNPIAVVKPALGKPALASNYHFTATTLDVLAPALGTPIFHETTILDVDNFAVQSPTFGTPLLTKVLYPTSLAVHAPALGVPATVICRNLTANPLATPAPVLDHPATLEIIPLVANDLDLTGLDLRKPDFFQHFNLQAVGVTVTPEFARPIIIQHSYFVAVDLTVAAPAIDVPTYGTNLAVISLKVTRPELGEPKIQRFAGVKPPWVPGTLYPHPGSAVLYRAATALERAMADADAERLVGTNAELIIDVWNPYAISARNLPYLAWGMGALLWEPEWSESTKREWTAVQWPWKALRGTEEGIRMALDYAGRDFVGELRGYDLIETMAPPQGFFAAPDLTKDQWDEWIRMMPQLRIKFASYTGTGSDEFFAMPAETWANTVEGETGMAYAGGFVGEYAAGRDDGWELYGRKAVLRYADGTEEALKLSEWEIATEMKPAITYGRASIPGVLGEKGGFIAEPEEAVTEGDIGEGGFGYCGEDTYVCFEELAPKTVAYRLDTTYEHTLSTLHLDYLTPGFEPIDVRYERDSDVGDDAMNIGFFVRDHAGDEFATDGSEAAEMLADRIYLHDPAVVEPMMLGISFAGVDRVGFPAYHAELLIDLRTKTDHGDWIAGEGIVGDDETFVNPENGEHIDRALRAVCAAKALRDKIAVSFEAVTPIRFRDPALQSEATTFGAYQRHML